MQRTLTDLFQTKHTFFSEKAQQTLSKDGLFACKKQKDIFIQRLKKGTLFRLAGHLKPETKIITNKDPYLSWLEENSTDQFEESPCERAMGETFFYVNGQDMEKQKKLNKTTLLPTIQKFKSAHIQHSLPHKSKRKETSSFSLKNHQIKDLQIISKQKLNKHKTCFEQLKKSQQSSSNNNKTFQRHNKQICFETKLNKTQLYPKQANHSFYQNKENLIKSQFYLNDHKKKHGFQTFYLKPKPQLKTDPDLKRVKGLEKVLVKSFDQNLLKLQKQASVSCYDQVSKYFRTMKSQVKEILQQGRDQKQQRASCKDYHRQKNLEMGALRRKIALNSLKQLKESRELKKQNLQQKNESHLPQFLLKSLILPKNNKQSMSPSKFSLQKDSQA